MPIPGGTPSSALDVLTLDEAKLAVANNAGATNDPLLAAWVTGVSQFLDEICGPVVIRTITDELHDGGHPSVILRDPPVNAVTTVTEFDGTISRVLTAETFGSVPEYGYLVDEPLTGMIHRRSNGWNFMFPIGRRNVKVTYDAGRYADTASVDERFKRAAAITLANAWRREHGGAGAALGVVGVTFGLPDAARAWIHRDLRAGVAE